MTYFVDKIIISYWLYDWRWPQKDKSTRGRGRDLKWLPRAQETPEPALCMYLQTIIPELVAKNTDGLQNDILNINAMYNKLKMCFEQLQEESKQLTG